uniref:Ethylene-responsive nuclear family protein n=1 Tax=Noccaea caerulescens TaxID=107243 RepID=A0A1J3IDZ8_NOCCA
MSPPWKTSGRISRFMSEFQQSRKRGGSLFVETGFPTSLVDLFVKNCHRLKRSSSKRLHRQNQTSPNASFPVNHDVILEKPVARKTVRSSKIDKDTFFGGGFTAENNDANGKNVYVSFGGYVLMAFQVIIVALLALSTKKKLTMGITLSAIALLLTELVAARVVTRFKLCNTGTEKVKPVVSVHDKNVIPREKIETFGDSKDEKRGPKTISCLDETELVAVTEKPSSKDLTIRDLLLKDEKKSKSKSSRLKSKIVKTLRSYKKMKKANVIKEETLTEVSSLVSEDKSEINESERDEERSNPPLTQSKEANMTGIVLIVIVLIGLLCGKILAFGLTLSCLFLRLGAAKKFGFCR